MRVFILAEVRIRRRQSDICYEEQLVCHVPSVAMDRDYERLGKTWFVIAERIYHVAAAKNGLARSDYCLKTVHIDPAREMIAMAEEDRGAQCGVTIIIIVGSGECLERLRIDPILYLGSIDSNQSHLAAPFDRHLVFRGQRHLR
jgi:hypothetical protein